MTYYFYDLETTGVRPRSDRVMQFAGQRTDADLHPLGEPDDLYIKLTPDVLPDPAATLLTGITPQMTLRDGLSEAEFLRYFTSEIATPDTIFVGFNTIRFDDEFLRYLHWRNYYDAYSWHWADGRGRWDLLDVVRMMRALRPEGLVWPVDDDGKPTNRLELLTAANGIDHTNAHTALSDVQASIDLARLLRQMQPKLYDYLFKMRPKTEQQKLYSCGPFVYTSGHFESRYQKTTAAAVVADLGEGSLLTYDLRYDPAAWAELTDQQLRDADQWQPDETAARLPFKKLQLNRCPAVAPLGVLDEASQQRLDLNLNLIKQYDQWLKSDPGQILVRRVVSILNEDKSARRAVSGGDDPSEQLYDGFADRRDGHQQLAIQAANAKTIASLQPHFHDQRLSKLWPLYKGRNYPKQLSPSEQQAWDNYWQTKLLSGQPSRLEQFVAAIDELDKPELNADKKYLLDELRLYAQSIMP